jgi:hypothetical protein
MLRVYDEQGENVNKNPAGTMIPDRVVCLELARPTISVDLTESYETLFFELFETGFKLITRETFFIHFFTDDLEQVVLTQKTVSSEHVDDDASERIVNDLSHSQLL